MSKVILSDNCVLINGNCLEVMKDIKDIHACVTDPPYNLGFMGKEWDKRGISFCSDTWKIVNDTLLPGAHLLSFAGTRTYHRIASAIEDGGFEIRDMISWLYGTGFPKSHNISKAIDKMKGAKRQKIKISSDDVRNPKAFGGGRDGTEGATRPWIEKALECGYHEKDDDNSITEEVKQWEGWGTALKPACEPICFARKPLSEKNIAENVLKNGTGAINIDDCRIELFKEDDLRLGGKGEWNIKREASKHTVSLPPKIMGSSPLGRFPANVIHDGSEEVIEHFPETQSGTLLHRHKKGNKTTDIYGSFKENKSETEYISNKGSAARFFYCAKASSKERGEENKHPTVKPLSLMSYLCRLITPPNGTILDPFMGSGTTGIAAVQNGFGFIGIEQNEEYFNIAIERIKKAINKEC